MDLNSPAPRGSAAAPPSFLPQPVGQASSGESTSQPPPNYAAGINAQEAFDENFLISTVTEPLTPPRSQAAHPVPPPPNRKLAPINHDDDDGKFHWAEALQGAPPWLGSMVIHMLLLIIMGLIVVNVVKKKDDDTTIQAVYGEQLGDQLLENNEGGLSTDKPDLTVDKTVFSPVDLPPVADPLAAPPMVTEFSTHGSFAGSTKAIDAPIGLALTGREKGMKIALLGRYGGNKLTEDSVIRALEWLKRNQRPSGLWTLNGPYTDPGDSENKVAATAMALLAFQGNGNTPHVNADAKHDYKAVVKKGWDALLKLQDANGQFVEQGANYQHTLYLHAQATIALCELYGMTEDSSYRAPAERAIRYCVKIQDEQGGWRYEPGVDTDTSVTGWFMMALQSAMMAHLEVPPTTLQNISRYLDHAQIENGSQYAYKPGAYTTNAMTAEGLLCRQYLGWNRDDPRLIGGVQFLLTNPIGKAGEQPNVYYWYYATQVMHHMGGDYWNRWNSTMRQYLPETQVKRGPEEGSWDPTTDRWGSTGGRLFVTCLRTYMLEVYYRHLPIYKEIPPSPAQPKKTVDPSASEEKAENQ